MRQVTFAFAVGVFAFVIAAPAAAQSSGGSAKQNKIYEPATMPPGSAAKPASGGAVPPSIVSSDVVRVRGQRYTLFKRQSGGEVYIPTTGLGFDHDLGQPLCSQLVKKGDDVLVIKSGLKLTQEQTRAADRIVAVITGCAGEKIYAPWTPSEDDFKQQGPVPYDDGQTVRSALGAAQLYKMANPSP